MEIWPVDPGKPVPPYEQLRTQIAGRIASGELEPGARLPTVRGLATELGLAATTVARVYRELEADGVVVTEGRRGTFVKASSAASSQIARDAAAAYARTARQVGLTLPEATRLLDGAWTT
jgi:DNA-binding transcriptional regulator YhcF (GntR family)